MPLPRPSREMVARQNFRCDDWRVNDFVNPQHRGVNLPAGFKDLMEVLEAKEKAGHEIIREPRVQDLSSNGLLHVEKALDLFLKSEAEDSLLSFFLERGQSTFALFRGGKGVKAICCFRRGVVLERTVQEVFAEAGAVPSSEVRNPVAGYQVFTYQLPLVRSQLLKIVIELLQRAYEVSDREKLGILIRA